MEFLLGLIIIKLNVDISMQTGEWTLKLNYACRGFIVLVLSVQNYNRPFLFGSIHFYG